MKKQRFEIVVRFEPKRSWLSRQMIDIWYKRAKAKRIIKKAKGLKQIQFRFEKEKPFLLQQ
ncbi:MAG: hypothetical protein BWK80_62725 [Desulfobacteraceae bacterium IS3]|nr:MAG: hypothetical protein BWK80_62725 [Desulfobacteraceae bacterium IS3]HAO23484.1 hypothetical protein [Desulfobacteraceae bacterium]